MYGNKISAIFNESIDIISKSKSLEKSIQNVIERIFNTAKPVLSIIGPDASSYKNVDITSLLQ